MNIFFDLDYTLIAFDGSPRPRAHLVLTRLKDDGHHLFIWSGLGIRTEEVQRLGLYHLVSGVFQKPTESFEHGLSLYNIPMRPDFVVDDHAEVVDHFGGVTVRPYFWPDPTDTEMERVYQAVQALYNGHGLDTYKGEQG